MLSLGLGFCRSPMIYPRCHYEDADNYFYDTDSVCITSVIRLPYLYFAAGSADVTWNVAAVAMWSGIELNVAIICACLLVMKPLLTWTFRGLCVMGGGMGATGLDQEGYDSSRAIQLSSSHGTSRAATPQALA